MANVRTVAFHDLDDTTNLAAKTTTLALRLVRNRIQASDELATGDTHTCAITVESQVACWGGNVTQDVAPSNYLIGALGTAGDDALKPQLVPGLTNVKSIASESRHTCALKYDGTVWCWGYNVSGSVGDGSLQADAVPVPTDVGLIDIVKITTGNRHSCALNTSGQAWCWGYGDEGALGNSSYPASQPKPIRADLMAQALSDIQAGSGNTCGIVKTTGELWCWGRNAAKQISTVTPTFYLGGTVNVVVTPVKVADPNPAFTTVSGQRVTETVVVGDNFICMNVSNASQGTRCWGNNLQGQLGNGSFTSVLPPNTSRLLNLDLVTMLSAAGSSTCGIYSLNIGNVFCWGDNNIGQVGNVSTTVPGVETPTIVSGSVRTGAFLLGKFIYIANSRTHACAKNDQGDIYCWGSNKYGQLGRGSNDPISFTPFAPGKVDANGIVF